jgi:SpoIID/LytB domain protein
MRKLLPILIASIAFAIPAARADAAPSTFTFVGSGYGHGVGLSQIGAKGQALESRTATEIIQYYFPSSEVTPVEDTQIIRVNVGHQLLNAKLSLDKKFPNALAQIFSGETNTVGLLSGRSILAFSMVGKQIALTSTLGKAITQLGISPLWTIRWDSNTSLLNLNTGTSIGLKYGFIQFRAVPITGQGYRMEIVNSMRLHDEYLYGVSEVPSSWPREAMAAQVIASRTYALTRMNVVRKACDCHIYSTKYDQNYAGYSKESEAKWGALWKTSVNETLTDDGHGLAITFNGAPISVFFSSSSGGYTARSEDVWGTPLAYSVSVPDPWSLDPKLNPGYSTWTRVVSQSVMASAFGLPDVTKYVINSRTTTGAVLYLTGYSSTGEKKKLSVSAFKTAVKLPSSWFDLPAAVTPANN